MTNLNNVVMDLLEEIDGTPYCEIKDTFIDTLTGYGIKIVVVQPDHIEEDEDFEDAKKIQLLEEVEDE